MARSGRACGAFSDIFLPRIAGPFLYFRMMTSSNALRLVRLGISSFIHLALVAIVAIAAIGCDTTEDPRLLNPPLPDSTLFRVVNLSDGEAVYASINGQALAVNLGSMQSTPYKPVLFVERVNIIVTRGDRRDTLFDQSLTAGVRATLFVATRGDQTVAILRQAGTIELQDLIRDNIARTTFINAVPDSAAMSVRVGCQSGEPLFRDVPFGGTVVYESGAIDLSLYLFAGLETSARASAHLPLQPGSITWVIAARSGGSDRMYAIGPYDAGIRELPRETRTDASIEVLNALNEGNSISASLSGDVVATDIAALQLSSASMVPACRTPAGDSLVIVPSGGGSIRVPLRMDVGSRSLAIVYGSQSDARALSLRLDPPPGVTNRAHVRLVNVSTVAPGSQLQIGSGAPDSASLATTFPSLPTGGVSAYVAVTPGIYPLLLQESGTGRHLFAGIENLAAGYHTVIIADRGGSAEILVLDHDANSSSLGGLDLPGSRARLFNLMTDGDASFDIGPLTVSGLSYSYTASTVVPLSIASVTTNAGATDVDHASGSLIIGVTGAGDGRRVISFRSPTGSPAGRNAAIRVLNAVPGVGELEVEIDPSIRVSARFGEATESVERNAGRFSFFVRSPGDTTVLARITGVELRQGRRYLLVIGPRRSIDEGSEPYVALLIQE